MLLTYLGACHPEAPFVLIRKLARLGIVGGLFGFKALWVVPYSGGVPRMLG